MCLAGLLYRQHVGLVKNVQRLATKGMIGFISRLPQATRATSIVCRYRQSDLKRIYKFQEKSLLFSAAVIAPATIIQEDTIRSCPS